MDDVQVMNLIGDVKGKVAVMVDDMIDTAGMDSRHVLRIFRVTVGLFWFIIFPDRSIACSC